VFTLFGLVLTTIGIAIALRGWSAPNEAKRSLQWPSVDGVIRTSGIESSESRTDDGLGTVRKFTPAVTYTFRVGGAERRRTQIAIGMSNLSGELAEAERVVTRYPVGKHVRVYFDPASRMAVLEPGNTKSANTIVGIGLGIAITGGLLVLISHKLG